MGIDYGLVVPDEKKTLRGGAVKPWHTNSYKECQAEMEQYADAANVRLDTPWEALDEREKRWVIDGTPDWKGGANAWKTQWYGAQRFFDWLESRAYKMRSAEHTSELQPLMRISYAVFCLKKKKNIKKT